MPPSGKWVGEHGKKAALGHVTESSRQMVTFVSTAARCYDACGSQFLFQVANPGAISSAALSLDTGERRGGVKESGIFRTNFNLLPHSVS